MIFFLETIHEHALAIDFAMFVIIWIVQVIVYPSFLFLELKVSSCGILVIAVEFLISFFL